MLKIIKYSLLPVTCSAVFGCQSNHSASDIDRMVSELTEKAVLDQVFIEGGTFVMGDFGAVQNGRWRPYFPPSADEDVAHAVELSSFYLSKYEVSWREWDLYRLSVGKPIFFQGLDGKEERAAFDQDADSLYYINKPARVEWQEAKDFCLWVGQLTGHSFELPTSAQWEFAARNRGSKAWLYPTHDGQPTPNDQQKHMQGCDAWTGICPVGQRYPPNPLGLYDMAGNAKEWVEDWFSPTYYRESEGVKNPTGPSEGKEKVLRSTGLGSLDFSFTITKAPLIPQDGILVRAGFRCAVQSSEPIR
ncbi:SUMF1/EgtB/PvdO family nonheme iron enzyme [Halopseudomonas sp. SMJS2]|uniref:formylglycine-generating enzyme family protein n=1 Tax=Halopseudomonas sp. SMJS2 TaxID=3041098 RepID=UPI0024534416|nr:SUMF1/EgtB/PvdO family nonheme iron enzyme [Halopseudomonas sp. SMJS2]WGK62213.1 SUMF1/EgtB/PvdO family nonheme iron enzyme [Halopseudomonas sp. SMJS2]